MPNQTTRLNLITPTNPADGMLTPGDWELINRLFELSDREASVAQMLFGGRNREQIALELKKEDGGVLSPQTVRVYIDRLFRKLNVQSHSELAIRILRVRELVRSGEFLDDDASQNL